MSFPRYQAYKDSGVEWLGEVPEHWEVLPLKREFDVVGGSTPKSDMQEYWDGDIQWITPADLSRLQTFKITASIRTITAEGLNSCGTTMVPSGSVVVSTRAPIGSLGIAGIDLCTNQGCKALVPIEQISSRFTAYFLGIATEALNVRGRGATFLEISGDELGAFKVTLPPCQEQVQIATFLERETAKIDALIAEQQRLIELLQEKRQAVISHAVTKGLNPNAPMKDSGVEWLGEVPEHWEVMDLAKTTLLLQTGPFGSQLGTADYKDEGVAVINPSNISEGSIDTSSGPFIATNKALELERHKLYKGDLVIARRGEMGRCAVVEDGKEEKLCGTGSILVRPLVWMCTDFTAEIIRSEYSRASLSLNSVGSTMENLSAAIVGRLRIPVPPRDEQVQIVDWIRSIASSYQSLAHNSVRAIELLQERRSALISAAVTGQIDVRGLVKAESCEK